MYSKNLLLALIFVLAQTVAVFAAPVNEKRTTSSSIPEDYQEYDVFFRKPENWGEKVYAYIYTDDEELNRNPAYHIEQWPGTELLRFTDIENETDVYYNIFAQGLCNKSRIIFTDGVNQAPGKMQEGFIFPGPFSVYTINGFVGYTRYIEPEHDEGRLYYNNDIGIFYTPKLGNTENPEEKKMYIHYKVGGRDWTEVPGEEMTLIVNEDGTYYYVYDFLNFENEEDVSFVFTDGKGHWDNNNGKNYYYKLYNIFDIYVESDMQFY